MRTRLFKTTTRQFYFLIGLYALASILVRIFLSSSFELDETEAIFLSQRFLWGYNIQPPLYAWVSMIFFKLFGTTLFALSLLKFSLLSVSFIYMFKAVRSVTGNEEVAFTVAISFLFFHEILYETQVDRTNSVMVLTIAVLTFYIYVTMLSNLSWVNYLKLGILIGTGVLGKYNYVLFIGGLIGASLFFRETRKIILNKWFFLITLVIALAVVLPHLLWLLDSFPLMVSGAHAEFNMVKENYFVHAGKGLLSLISETAACLTPMWLIYLVIVPAGYRKMFNFTILKSFTEKTNNHNYSKQELITALLDVFFILLSGVLILSVLFFGVTRFLARWLVVFMFLFPLYYFIKLQNGEDILSRLRILNRSAFGLVILVFCLLFARAYLPDYLNQYTRLNYPFEKIAVKIKKQGFLSNQMVISNNQLIAGNLKVHLNASIALTPATVRIAGTDGKKNFSQILLVWKEQNTIPDSLLTIAGYYANINKRDLLIKKAETFFYNSKKKTYTVLFTLIQLE